MIKIATRSLFISILAITVSLPLASCSKEQVPEDNHETEETHQELTVSSEEETALSPETDSERVEVGQFLGLEDCYCTREHFGNGHFGWTFYDSHDVEIARQFGFDIADKPEYYLEDLDRDGNDEVVINCEYGGDGCRRVFIYRNNNGVIEIGSLDEDQVASALGFDSGLGGELAHDEYYDEEKGELVLYSCTEGRNYNITADDFVYQDYSGFGF